MKNKNVKKITNSNTTLFAIYKLFTNVIQQIGINFPTVYFEIATVSNICRKDIK